MLERRHLTGGVTALVSTGMESEGFLAAFTERTGGASHGVFRSLNLGLGSGDDLTLVRQNRGLVLRGLGVEPFACGRQVHGARVARVGAAGAGAGFEDPRTNLDQTDGLVTSIPGVSLAVITADCVPLALASPASGTVAVVHAGWRGIAAGIVQAALRAFPSPDDVRAAIGPAVGPDHYEVEEEVAAAVTTGAGGEATVVGSGSRPRLDLPATVERILRRAGVTAVENAGECTACEDERFFSHRRDGPCGRQAVVAVRLP